ncbi:MAG: helix-hairpin-helix domain-containing protein [Anaerolineales bacterium]|jgi:predicted flap endonuclease-1-like 5' DNA nuclease
MFKKLFAADSSGTEDSMFGKLFMGLLLGAAVGWVLLKRFQRPISEVYGERHKTDSTDEIEITTAVLSMEADESDSQVSVETETTLQQDRLEVIKGIGPVFARRLHEAGINTFADLAAASPEKLREIVAAKSWQAVEPDEWIKAAAALS